MTTTNTTIHVACNGTHYVLNDSYAITWTEDDLENGKIEIKLTPVVTINDHRYAIYVPLVFCTLRDIPSNDQLVRISSMILDGVVKYSDHVLYLDDSNLYLYHTEYGVEDAHLLDFQVIKYAEDITQSFTYTINVKSAYDDHAVSEFKSVPSFIADCQCLLYDGHKYTTEHSTILIVSIEDPAWEVSEEVSL